jgi:hypothetical protein
MRYPYASAANFMPMVGRQNTAPVAVPRATAVEGVYFSTPGRLAVNRGPSRSSAHCWKCSTGAGRLMRDHQRGTGGFAGERTIEA